MRSREDLATMLAGCLLRCRSLEQLFALACRVPTLRRCLRLGAIANGFRSATTRHEIREAGIGNYRLVVDISDILGMEPYLFGSPGVSWVVPELVKPGQTCFDVGANVGHHALYFAQRLLSSGKVAAFEPNPKLRQMLERSVALNGFGSHTSVESKALWSKSGEHLSLFLPADRSNSGTSSLIPDPRYNSSMGTISVETVTLDDWCSQHSVPFVDVLKIDVERAEAEVLEGAKDLLAKGRIAHLIVELTWGNRAVEVLSKAGYRGALIASDHLVCGSKVQIGTFGDYLFVSPNALSQLPERLAAGFRNKCHQIA